MASFTDSEDNDNKPSPSVEWPGIMSLPSIRLMDCVLYAPSPNGPPPTTREKPPGCKTVFIGGLPENTTEEIMRELFEMVGEISTVRMSVKNFCHIRFAKELFVDRAIGFSGYRIKIDDKDDAPNTGRLHVDYAEARDDQFEYKCRQVLLEKTRSQMKEDDNVYCPPSPPSVTHYSDHEAIALSTKLRAADTFQEAAFVLIAWLEGGVCSRKNAGYFYSMIQSSMSHIHRLRNEKIQFENELNQAMLKLQDQMRNILLQFDEIGKVFTAATVQKAWDHFTKAQRKNIMLWKDELEEVKSLQMEEIVGEKTDDDMNLSDDENAEEISQTNECSIRDKETASEIEKLREENDSLRCQLSASENEVELARAEMEAERVDKENKINQLVQSIQNAYKNRLLNPEEFAPDNSDAEPSVKRTRMMNDVHSESSRDSVQECTSSSNVVTSSSGNTFSITGADARYVGLVSTFLCAHPFGANIDYICSYLNEFNYDIHARDLEILMEKFPVIFKKQSTGIGARLEKKWSFCGFEM